MKFWQQLRRKRPEQIEREIEEELRFHLAMRAQQNLAAGMSTAQAETDARQRFGDYEAVKMQCRAIAREKLAHSLPRRIFNSLIWIMLGCGLTLRFLSNIDTVQQCGTILILISVTWRLLLYVRLNGLLRQPIDQASAPLLPVETPTTNNFHSSIPYYDTQGRTPVERVLANDE
jgi:hypothetical protein